MAKKILWMLGCLLIGLQGFAQNDKRKEAGLRLGFGFSNEVLPERKEYQPLTILPYFNYYISKSNTAAQLSIYAEPQLTPVIIDYQYSRRKIVEYEFGMNGGLIFNYRIGDFNIYTGAGSGPNFISMQTRQQADGFLFSDNFFLGLKKEMKGNYQLDAQFRVRHISNAGLQTPNKGIDNMFAVAGISKFITKTPPPASRKE